MCIFMIRIQMNVRISIYLTFELVGVCICMHSDVCMYVHVSACMYLLICSLLKIHVVVCICTYSFVSLSCSLLIHAITEQVLNEPSRGAPR